MELALHLPNASERVQALLHDTWSDFVAPRSRGTLPVVACHFDEADTPAVATLGSDLARAPQAAALQGGAWYCEWQYYRAVFAPDRAVGQYAQRLPGFEHLVRGAVAWATMPDRGLLFHGATLVWGDEALLVAGHPGAGKSTISREGGADRVISNEISIVQRRADGWWALPSPFWGTGDRPYWRAPARLTGITVLAQAPTQNHWAPLSGVHAIAALAPHAGTQAAAQAAQPGLLAALQQLIVEVPAWSFAWHRASDPLSGSPWKPSLR